MNQKKMKDSSAGKRPRFPPAEQWKKVSMSVFLCFSAPVKRLYNSTIRTGHTHTHRLLSSLVSAKLPGLGLPEQGPSLCAECALDTL